MYNHNKAQQSKNCVHIYWDILYSSVLNSWMAHGGLSLTKAVAVIELQDFLANIHFFLIIYQL